MKRVSVILILALVLNAEEGVIVKFKGNSNDGIFSVNSIDSTESIDIYEQMKEEYKNRDFKVVIRKDNGAIRKEYIPIDNNLQTTQATEKREGVIIAFEDESQIDISSIETKYNIKFKNKLHIGYYIFDNTSDMDDTSLVNEIILNESNAKTVMPNWPMQEEPY